MKHYEYKSVITRILTRSLIAVLIGCQVAKSISDQDIEPNYISTHLAQNEWILIKTIDGVNLEGAFMFLDLNALTAKDKTGTFFKVPYSQIDTIHFYKTSITLGIADILLDLIIYEYAF